MGELGEQQDSEYEQDQETEEDGELRQLDEAELRCGISLTPHQAEDDS